MSRHLNFYMTKIVPFTTLKVDLNSFEFLQSLYRDLKQLFMDKCDRFNKENITAAATAAATSPAPRPVHREGNESSGGWGKSSAGITSDNEKIAAVDNDFKSSSTGATSAANPLSLGNQNWTPSNERPKSFNKFSKNSNVNKWLIIFDSLESFSMQV